MLIGPARCGRITFFSVTKYIQIFHIFFILCRLSVSPCCMLEFVLNSAWFTRLGVTMFFFGRVLHDTLFSPYARTYIAGPIPMSVLSDDAIGNWACDFSLCVIGISGGTPGLKS